MKYGFLIVLLFLSVKCIAQTNHTDFSTAIDVNAEAAWNFVVDAKNLIEDEKRYFNTCTSSADRSIFGFHEIRIIESRVKALDAQREVEKILAELKNKQKVNNTIWIREEILRDMINKNISEANIVKWMTEWYISTNDVIELGLRDDGVIVWRNLLNSASEGIATNDAMIKK